MLARLQMQAGQHIDQHALAIEQPDGLKGAENACTGNAVRRLARHVMTLQEHSAFGRLVNPRDDVEHRGLACPVGSDQAEHLARLDGETQIGHSLQAAEADAHSIQAQQVFAHRCASLRSRRGQIPWGRSTMTTTMAMPNTK
ncbi:hypothetical protein GALL_409190 [mine drainage metagenome]|uniref:Uncharacterized protein n=1 Tax=mine drainage metagenome TaxID=410659 RepID=A0A1J5Q0Y5_9ZZZZ